MLQKTNHTADFDINNDSEILSSQDNVYIGSVMEGLYILRKINLKPSQTYDFIIFFR